MWWSHKYLSWTKIFVNAKCTSLWRAEGSVGSIRGHDKAVSFNWNNLIRHDWSRFIKLLARRSKKRFSANCPVFEDKTTQMRGFFKLNHLCVFVTKRSLLWSHLNNTYTLCLVPYIHKFSLGPSRCSANCPILEDIAYSMAFISQILLSTKCQ